MTRDEINKFKENNKTHFLPDGIYRIDSQHIILQEEIYYLLKYDNKELKEFITDNPDYAIASRYGTFTTILFKKRPKPFYGKTEGSGFNFGSTNIISQINTDSLLIIAKDN